MRGGGLDLWLAERHPDGTITAIDNAPYVEYVNKVATEYGVDNIEFRNIDLREITLGEYDIVFSHAVIYCIPDNFLLNYFETLVNHTKPGGSLFVGTAANISPMLKLRLLLPKKKIKNRKQTGWDRDWKHVKQFLPKNVEIIKMSTGGHYSVPLVSRIPFLSNFIGMISEKIYPISHSKVFVHLKKK